MSTSRRGGATDHRAATRVRLGSELWKAELVPGGETVSVGSAIRVVEVRGLTLVVEPVTTKPDGWIRTRRTTLVRQGDQTIAVLKGRKRETNPSTDFLDEDDLEQGRY